MKYIIKESRLEGFIINYLNEIFPVDDINQTNPWDYDDETGIEGEDDNRVTFFLGNYDHGDNDIFKWYDCDYFVKGAPLKEACPLVVVEYQYSKTLNSYFGDTWKEPFTEWFKDNFSLPVKTVD
jgi:hypothetical protein